MLIIVAKRTFCAFLQNLIGSKQLPSFENVMRVEGTIESRLGFNRAKILRFYHSSWFFFIRDVPRTDCSTTVIETFHHQILSPQVALRLCKHKWTLLVRNKIFLVHNLLAPKKKPNSQNPQRANFTKIWW